MVSTDSDHYPERLGQLVLINAPSVLSIAWRVIQGTYQSLVYDLTLSLTPSFNPPV